MNNDSPRIRSTRIGGSLTHVRHALVAILARHPSTPDRDRTHRAPSADDGAPVRVVTEAGDGPHDHPRWCPVDHSGDHLGSANRYAMFGYRDGELAGTVTTDLEVYDHHDEFHNAHTWWEFPDGTVVATFGFHPSDLVAIAGVIEGHARQILALAPPRVASH